MQKEWPLKNDNFLFKKSSFNVKSAVSCCAWVLTAALRQLEAQAGRPREDDRRARRKQVLKDGERLKDAGDAAGGERGHRRGRGGGGGEVRQQWQQHGGGDGDHAAAEPGRLLAPVGSARIAARSTIKRHENLIITNCMYHTAGSMEEATYPCSGQ